MKTKHFVNLTNGILAIPELDQAGIPYEFIRIQSTTLENKNWIKLFTDLDHNFLINLALGNMCIVYDYGTNRPYSKTIYMGLEIIRYILNRYWYNYDDLEARRYTRNGKSFVNGMRGYYNEIYEKLFIYDSTKEKIALKNKLKYYKRFLNDNTINLEGRSESTDKDGNYEYMSNLLKKYN